MQEEKKNNTTNTQSDNKKHNSKKRGYFVEPPSQAQNKGDAPKKQVQNAGSNSQETKNSHPNPQNHNKKRNHKPNNASNQNAPQRPDPTVEKAPAATIDSSAISKEQSTQVKKKKNNHNKKKKKNPVAPTSQPNAQTNSESQQQQPKHNDKQKSRAPIKDATSFSRHSSDDYEEYVFSPDVASDTPTPLTKKKEQDDPNEPKTEVVGVRFKSSGKVYYFAPNGRTFKRGSNAIVDTARGQEFGEVTMSNTFVRTSDLVPPLRPVIRNATTADVEHHRLNKIKEEDAFKICNGKIAEHKLEMKLIDAQYTFDNSKLLFYFASSERVDFRELVKDLASVFRTRIELRQIGIRDEAKIMGGLGMCGRPLCCALFLSDFEQVSIKMAKEQNLSLNSAKISGVCGRLMCCLKYEHEAYEYEIKRTPPVDSLVRTENGDGIVTEISPLAGTVKVRLLASPDVPPKSYKREDITMLRKKQNSDKKDD